MTKMQIKTNLKNVAQKLAVIAIGLLVAISASYVSAMSRPSDINTNYPEVLNVGDATQMKDGLISTLAFMAGDYATTSTSNYLLVDNLGIMAIGKSTTPDPSTGISLDIAGTTGIMGTIRAKDLASSGLKEVCADKDGKIVFCTKEQEFVAKYSDKPTYYGIMVPEGTKSMTVEIYGAGGAGYSKVNSITGSDEGQSSYIIGDGISIIAEGGTAANSSSAGGKGGTVSIIDTSSLIDSTSKTIADGGDGTAPGSFSSSPSQYGGSNKCSGTTYITIKGAKGNVGGKGGKPYNGSNASGGSAGDAGPTSGSSWNFNVYSSESNPPINYTDCKYAEQSSDDFVSPKNTRPGGNGVDGASFGAGGSGFGGKGGLSKVTSDSINNCTNCKGGDSVAGGGAGAYIKAKIDTTKGGNTYYLKVGNGGSYDTKTYQCGNDKCLDQIGGGAFPGKGAPGYIKITYNN
ncbi:hypothetical protein IT400_02275 [Candidatus Nomurabacteria bacterium]|nr:hypothetical protein [Candidatus Nomurabacteria bacterium]